LTVWWQLVVLGIAMGMNNALASVALGAMRMPRREQLRIALVFGLFEALMPVIGVMIGEQVAGLVGKRARWIGIALLTGFGLYSLLKRDTEDDDAADKRAQARGMQVLLLAAALSLDNLTIGFGLGMLQVPLAAAAIVFGFISLSMAWVGLELGRWLGTKVNVSTDKVSGVVLLITAGLMLIR
jgi:putative Mn2+ efflux pump MntP